MNGRIMIKLSYAARRHGDSHGREGSRDRRDIADLTRACDYINDEIVLTCRI